jgi:hypothetical protein
VKISLQPFYRHLSDSPSSSPVSRMSMPVLDRNSWAIRSLRHVWKPPLLPLGQVRVKMTLVSIVVATSSGRSSLHCVPAAVPAPLSSLHADALPPDLAVRGYNIGSTQRRTSHTTNRLSTHISPESFHDYGKAGKRIRNTQTPNRTDKSIPYTLHCSARHR